MFGLNIRNKNRVALCVYKNIVRQEPVKSCRIFFKLYFTGRYINYF